MAKIREALDTNILVRSFLKTPAEQYEKVAQLMERADVNYYVPPMAIYEFVYLVHKSMGFSREEVIDWLTKRFLNLGNVEYDVEFHEEVFMMFLKYPKLSYGDCYLSVETAWKQAEPLWTFDQALAKKSPVAKLVA